MTSLLLLKSMLFASALQKHKKKKERSNLEKNYAFDIKKMCRICNAEEGKISIFKNNYLPNIPEEIKHFSGVAINKADDFSKHICHECLKLLKGCIRFRDLCQKNNRRLIEMSVKKETINIVNETNSMLHESEEFFNIPSPTFSDGNLGIWSCTSCTKEFNDMAAYNNHLSECNTILNDVAKPSEEDYPTQNPYPYSKHDFQLILHKIEMKRMANEKKVYQERKRKEKEQQKKDSKTKEFKCSFCDLVFSDKEKLAAHRREKQCMRRTCDICGQLVRSIAHHMRHSHKQNVLHKCTTCGKEFPIIARLKNHMLVHTNTFNFFCDLCPYKSKHKYYLVMHMRTHTGEKPYKCPHCPSTFVNPSNLNKHKLTHQEKKFKCMLCDKAFRTSAVLREHHDAMHMNIKHTCAYCGRDFCYKSDLRKHQIRNHNRTKRDYIGGEPTYKQVERIQKESDEMDKRQHQEVVIQPPPTQATFVDETKNYIQTSLPVYFTDVHGMLQPQDIKQPHQTVHVTLADLLLRKDDRSFNPQQQGMEYF